MSDSEKYTAEGEDIRVVGPEWGEEDEEVTTEKNWIPYRGPQGGEGWQDTQNPNDVRYDLDEPPGTVAAGYSEDHWEMDERSTSVEENEMGYVSEGAGGPSLDVATADHAQSLHEAGASEGASSRHMHVATWESEDGEPRRAFVTNYGPDMSRNETGEKPLLGERAIAADAFFRNMGFDPPKHFLNRQQRYLAVEGKDGKEVRHAPDEWKENIDRDEVLDFAATTIIAGNSDLHPKNVLVNENGEFFAVDLDKSGGDFANGPDRFQRRGFQSITWTARNLGHSLSKEEIDQRAQELCRDMDIDRMTENVENSTWSRKGRHQFRDNIITNIKALREGSLL